VLLQPKESARHPAWQILLLRQDPFQSQAYSFVDLLRSSLVDRALHPS